MNCKTGILYSTVPPSDELEGPLDFHGHGSWSMCKAALSQCSPTMISDSTEVSTGQDEFLSSSNEVLSAGTSFNF